MIINLFQPKHSSLTKILETLWEVNEKYKISKFVIEKWTKIMYPGIVPENPCFCCWGQTEVTSIRIHIKILR
jgi:hypothetical protein